jgi:hypothetical protein
VAHAASIALLLGVSPPVLPYAVLPTFEPRPRGAAPLLVALLLLTIAVRSFVGMSAFHACPKSTALSFSIAGAAFAGKTAGGLLADRFGWARAGVGALLISAPLLAFGSPIPALMVVGMFLFQITMPVTVAALLYVFPRRPAFVFGLSCVALVAGALATFSTSVAAWYSDSLFLGLILASAAGLWIALRDIEGGTGEENHHRGHREHREEGREERGRGGRGERGTGEQGTRRGERWRGLGVVKHMKRE